jgi:hypothetical protein
VTGRCRLISISAQGEQAQLHPARFGPNGSLVCNSQKHSGCRLTPRYKAREISLVENWRQLPDLHEGRILVHRSRRVKMKQKSFLREDPQFVSSVPTGNKRKLKQDE